MLLFDDIKIKMARKPFLFQMMYSSSVIPDVFQLITAIVQYSHGQIQYVVV